MCPRLIAYVLHAALSAEGQCVKVEVAVLGSQSLITLTVSLDVKHVKVQVAVLGSQSLITLTVSVNVKQS